MRKSALYLAAIVLMVPGAAMACHQGQASSIKVSCEQGVRVYRAAPLAAPAAPVILPKRVKSNIAQERAALQSERLAAQAERIDVLENRLDEANRPRRRRQIFSAPVGAFGAAPFVNRRRGFRNRRSSGIRVRFNRRRF